MIKKKLLIIIIATVVIAIINIIMIWLRQKVRSYWLNISRIFACIPIENWNILRPTKWRQNGANSQILICKGLWFGGSKVDTLNVKVTDKDFIFPNYQIFYLKYSLMKQWTTLSIGLTANKQLIKVCK